MTSSRNLNTLVILSAAKDLLLNVLALPAVMIAAPGLSSLFRKHIRFANTGMMHAFFVQDGWRRCQYQRHGGHQEYDCDMDTFHGFGF